MTLFTYIPTVQDLLNGYRQRLADRTTEEYVRESWAIMDEMEAHAALWIASNCIESAIQSMLVIDEDLRLMMIGMPHDYTGRLRRNRQPLQILIVHFKEYANA